MKSNFENDLKKGKIAEAAFIEMLEKLDYEVIDVSNSKQYQVIDVDIIAKSKIDNQWKMFEIKRQAMVHDGKVFIETVTSSKKKKKKSRGWFCKCKADYLVFHEYQAEVFHVFKFEELHSRIVEYILSGAVQEKENHDSKFYILPLDWMINEMRSIEDETGKVCYHKFLENGKKINLGKLVAS